MFEAKVCDIDVVVEGTPVAGVAGARKDGLAVRESVHSFILVMTKRSPRIPPGVLGRRRPPWAYRSW